MASNRPRNDIGWLLVLMPEIFVPALSLISGAQRREPRLILREALISPAMA